MNLKAIDFFCSGGGMSFGLKQAGIDVLAGIDIDPDQRLTNKQRCQIILADVEKLSEQDLSRKVSIKKMMTILCLLVVARVNIGQSLELIK